MRPERIKPSSGQLIALKAILIGHGAAVVPLRKRAAESLLESAISQLRSAHERNELLKCAFYLLVRAELHRIGGDPVPDRAAAKSISTRIRSDVFRQFMVLENQSESLLARRAPSLDEPTPPDPLLSPWYPAISNWVLSAMQYYFIHNATLFEIMRAHNLSVPADFQAAHSW